MMCILLALPHLVTISPIICCNIFYPSLMIWFTPGYTFDCIRFHFTYFVKLEKLILKASYNITLRERRGIENKISC